MSEQQKERPQAKPKLGGGMRLFSVESSASSSKFNFDVQSYAVYEYSLCEKEFFLKLLQILLGITSAGLYSGGFNAMLLKHISIISNNSQCNITTDHFHKLMFPNVVFGAFITITSVIAISYVLGQSMSEVLIRIFNAIGTVLYFVTACITGHVAYTLLLDAKIVTENNYDNATSVWMLTAQVVTSSLNFLLYAVDLGLSVRKAFTMVEIT